MSSPVACLILLVIIVASGQADHEADFRANYDKLKCHRGYVGKFTPKLDGVLKDCTSKSIGAYFCYFACVETGMGAFVDGAFYDPARREALETLFDPAMPVSKATIDTWMKYATICEDEAIKKGLKIPADYFGDCKGYEEMKTCIAKSRKCLV
ncbi:uncharacterized protein LOC110857434 [Folsomia candida]|uniref:uncharacterized protein LOC110857434 n=1 Tax=Folsomia candida TaxID=158441 RepID=UPI000B9024BE|nr:uncharacterized protein LOC110857434 [Folsomia candida]